MIFRSNFFKRTMENWMITIDRKKFVEPLSKIAKVSHSGFLPVLGCALIRVGGGAMTLTGTDTEVTLTAKIDGVEGDWVGCVPANKLLAVLKAMPSDGVSINTDGDRVTVAVGRTKMKLPVFPASDFPDLPPIDGEPIEVAVADFVGALNAARPAMAKRDARFTLNGALLSSDPDQDKLRVVATNGHRMVCAEIESALKCEVIVIGKGVDMIADLFAHSEKCHVQTSESLIRVQAGGFTITSKLIEGKYPDWQRVIPSTRDKVVVNAAAFSEALERAALMAPKNDSIVMRITSKRITLQASNESHESMEDSVDAESSAELTAGCNVRYMLDAVQAACSEDIEIGFTGPESGMIVRPVGRSQPFTVVMPVRI
jgi:DNA polymerase III subunit beta